LVEFNVRAAKREDFPAIRLLIHNVQINPIGLDWKRFLIVVSPTGNLLGCGQIKSHTDGSRELASVAVKEQARGQGLARVIISELLTLEQQRPIFLMCRARLQLLYDKFGFHPIKPEDMPPFFRRISRLERIINSKSQPEDRLLVMRLD
jgi:N-acetylglutamate synthase-like GNAT family acetyltransferase